VLLEPIQGEGGVVIPPEGFLRDVRALCTERNVLMIADEIQSGLAAPGAPSPATTRTSCPTSTSWARPSAAARAAVGDRRRPRDVLEVITPGSHGSTFGGNPFAAAIGREVVAMLEEGEFQERAARLGRGAIGDGDERATFAAYLVTLVVVPIGTGFLALKEKTRWAMGAVAVGAFAVAVMTIRCQQIWDVARG
jgi:acetylornithine/succinyldiaminopimelate/putrescine aminotransferase